MNMIAAGQTEYTPVPHTPSTFGGHGSKHSYRAGGTGDVQRPYNPDDPSTYPISALPVSAQQQVGITPNTSTFPQLQHVANQNKYRGLAEV